MIPAETSLSNVHPRQIARKRPKHPVVYKPELDGHNAPTPRTHHVIINIGSINLDHVYRVDHLALPGETISCDEYAVLGGGKGANQSLALARAGGKVKHIGKVGQDGIWLRNELKEAGVDVTPLLIVSEPSGHAVIQVDAHGMNSIVIFGGCNQRLDLEQVEKELKAQPPSTVLLQNETNGVARFIELAKKHGHRVAFNPAPMTAAVKGFPLSLVDTLIVNEHEAEALSDDSNPASLAALFPGAAIVVTLGGRGVVALVDGIQHQLPAFEVQAVDTVAAGDCFVGYLLAELDLGVAWPQALRTACAAAALSVSRRGAMASIPTRPEVSAFLKLQR